MLLAVLASLAWAHTPGLSTAVIERDTLSLTFAGAELADQGVTAADLRAGVALQAAGQPCALGPAVVATEANDGLRITWPLRCPAGERTYSAAHLDRLALGHRQVVQAFGLPAGVLEAHDRTVTFEGVARPGALAWAFVVLGVEHILVGWDHLTFLFALLLVATSLRGMLAVVTGFTLAHSLTLTLAATGVLAPPSALVEAAIAATIVYTGLENLSHPGARRRFVLTFLLGLVHGFGFAGVLAERGLPQEHRALALLSFNAGVELGQAALAAAVLPLLLRLRAFGAWERWAVPALSLACSAAGAFWLWERVSG